MSRTQSDRALLRTVDADVQRLQASMSRLSLMVEWGAVAREYQTGAKP